LNRLNYCSFGREFASTTRTVSGTTPPELNHDQPANQFIHIHFTKPMPHQPHLYVIAAMSENRVIGKENHLPWHLPDEWENFRKVTDGRPFLTGRKSFEAPDALHSSYRNLVLSRRPCTNSGTIEYVKDFQEALALLHDENEVFILGGASVFEQAIPLAEKLFLTIVHAYLEGDAFFPAVSAIDWELVSSEYHAADEQHAYAFSMNLYVRNSANSS
jgi:dihydrofolate reductase